MRHTAEPSPLKARDGEDGAPRTVVVTRPASADSEVARPAVTAHPAGVPAQPDASACRGAAGGLHSPRQGDDESGPAPASAEAISGTPLTTLSLLNIRGLKTASSNAMPYVTDTLHDSSLFSAVMSLTETWLNDHLEAEVSVPGYHLPFRVDRNRVKPRKGRGSGGVITYVHSSLVEYPNFLF